MARLLSGILLALVLLTACRTNVTPEQQVRDAEIVTRVKAKMAQEMGAGTLTNISVNSTNGVVTLSGQVDTAARKERAATIAKSIPNVTSVNNALQVTTTATR